MKCFLIFFLLLISSTGNAQRVIHRVRFGETLTGISSYYYGTPLYGPIISQANGLNIRRHLKVGEHIRVPSAWVYTVRKTTSLEAVTKQLLGHKNRWQTLVLINKLGRKKKILTGQQLLIPFILNHTVIPGETYTDLAKRYYGNPKLVGFITSYNLGSSNKLLAGTQIEIPISHVRITPLRLEELLNQRVLGIDHQPEQEEREALQETNALLRGGHYWRVPLRLLQFFARDQVADAQTAEVFKLLGIAYVALDQNELAIRSFQEALMHQPTLNIDLVTSSPKIVQAFLDAKSILQRNEP